MKILVSTDEFQKLAVDFLRLHPIATGRRVTGVHFPTSYSSCRDVTIELGDEPAASTPIATPALKPGMPFGGGFFAGLDMDDKRYAIVVAPKAEGQREDIDLKSALDFCASLRIGGFDDWRLPTKDELYIVYRGLGPNVTTAETFKVGRAEDYDERWYWSSTDAGSVYAWLQYFVDGRQDIDVKDNHGRCRAVRKVLI